MPPRDLAVTPTLDPVEDITRRRLLGALPLLGLMATGVNCGDDDEPDAGSDTWIYESEFGPVELPRKIERVVSADYYSPAALVDIGVVPVGVVNSYFANPDDFPAGYSRSITDGGAISIGEYWEFDVEAVATANPDVIFVTDDFLPLDSPVREQLERIAPIVTFTARSAGSWRTRSDGLAVILGREDELERLKSEYEQSRDALRERYAGMLDQVTFAVFSPEDGEWGVYARDHFTVGVLQDLDAHFIDQDMPKLGLDEDGYPTWLSYEELRLLNGADVILRNPGTDAAFAALEGNPLWATQPAVQQSLVFTYIDFSVTSSYGWAMQNLQDLDALFAEIQSKWDSRP